MSHKKVIDVALVGNPNTGKSTLFNQLTGLNQKVGNYPGVTVDKKQGKSKLSNDVTANIIDLPGTYSINPNTIDESIVLKTLLHKEETPDVVAVVADVVNLKRNLLLFSQIKDLEIPTVLAINMADEMDRRGISVDIESLEKELQTNIVLVSARKNSGLKELKETILKTKDAQKSLFPTMAERMDSAFFDKINKVSKDQSIYTSWLYLTQFQDISFLPEEDQVVLEELRQDKNVLSKLQHKETVLRYQQINKVLEKTYTVDHTKATTLRAKLDKILTHSVFGYLIFALILMLIFQSIFAWAGGPMDFIDESFTQLSAAVKNNFSEGMLTDLLADGIIPGVGGVVIFIPQIAILFLLIALLEETGYMSRVVFLMDKIMRRFGMSGKSVVPLISGTACAIPAIMATRNINGFKERLITILVTPFTTCSARIPVYVIIISLIIPNEQYAGFSLQGIILMLLYLLGFLMAVISGYILHKLLKVKSKSFFVIEMPDYKVPSLKNVLLTIIEKTKAFVFGAGKIILAISMILWFLATNGPSSFKNAEKTVRTELASENITEEEMEQRIASYKLEHSYIGIMGKTIEPTIKPLGYDWKMGIALISSFAAREVFVGTLATIYSVDAEDDELTLKEKMRAEKNPETGKSRYDLPTGMSLLIFYAFAMQCMATLAIVKRETKSWKWPLYQLIGMSAFAYIAAFITYTILK